jgi:integrase
VSSLNLQPRRVDFPAGSRLKSCTINPALYVAGRLISELADAWKDYAETVEPAANTVSGRGSAIRSVGKFLTEDSDRHLTLRSKGAEVTSRLHDWENWTIKNNSATSSYPKLLGLTIRSTVSYYLQSNDLDVEVISDWANGPVLDGRVIDPAPLDEFSNHERQQLESMCRQIVRDTESRLSRGDRLLEKGHDPRSYGWNQLDNMLWALRHLAYEQAFQVHLIGRKREFDPAEVDRMSGTYRDPNQIHKPALITAVGAFLVPDPEFLLAVRILLHLQTGWAPEETANLRRVDVEFGDTTVRVRTPKTRAHRVRWHTLETSAVRPWGWKAGDLLRRAAHAMRHAHAMTPNDSAFWMTAARVSPMRHDGEYPSWAIRAQTFQTPVSSLGQLIKRRELSIGKPHDMRRLRKTVKSARAVVLGTLNGAAGDDHTVEVFRGHYAQSTTVRTISAQTVIRVQQKILEQAVRGPVLVTESANAIASSNSGDPKFVELAGQVVSETPTEQELTISACRDPRDGPFTEQGALCHASPSMCLQCRNAVIFPEHLPRLLAYEAALESLEKTLPPIAYNEFYGQQSANLRALIAEFPPPQVELARGKARLHRPLGQRAEL